MRKLIFLHNLLKGTVSWLIEDETGEISERGTASTFLELQTKVVDRVEGFIFSPLFSNKRLEVPPTSQSQILESIPFLLEDSLLGSVEDYHFVISKRSEEGDVKVSLIPINSMEEEISLFREAQIYVSSLSFLDNSFKEEPSVCSLVLFDDISVINFGSEWGWCAETDIILNLLKKGLEDFKSTSLKVFLSKDAKKIDWTKYSKLEPDIIFIEGELDFLEKAFPSLENKFNLLTNKYAPRIAWREYFKKWKYGLAAASIVVVLYFSQTLTDIYQNNSSTTDLLEQSRSLYYSAYPNEPKDTDLKKLLRQKLRGVNLTGREPFLLTVQNLTQVIHNNERVSLHSVNYDLNSNQFIIEIQCTQFEDLETVKSTFIQGGYAIDVGSSKRVGNSILSELFIKKT